MYSNIRKGFLTLCIVGAYTSCKTTDVSSQPSVGSRCTFDIPTEKIGAYKDASALPNQVDAKNFAKTFETAIRKKNIPELLSLFDSDRTNYSLYAYVPRKTLDKVFHEFALAEGKSLDILAISYPTPKYLYIGNYSDADFKAFAVQMLHHFFAQENSTWIDRDLKHTFKSPSFYFSRNVKCHITVMPEFPDSAEGFRIRFYFDGKPPSREGRNVGMRVNTKNWRILSITWSPEQAP